MPGPHVQLATFCEKVLTEQDGVVTLVRVLDRIAVTVQGQGAPAELPEGILRTTLVVALKADEARGRHPVTIRPQQPSGVTLSPQEFDVMFEGDERGVNLILQMGIPAVEGLYWFDVLVSGVLLTRVPLRIMYQRVPTSG